MIGFLRIEVSRYYIKPCKVFHKGQTIVRHIELTNAGSIKKRLKLTGDMKMTEHIDHHLELMNPCLMKTRIRRAQLPILMSETILVFRI